MPGHQQKHLQLLDSESLGYAPAVCASCKVEVQTRRRTRGFVHLPQLASLEQMSLVAEV